MISNNIIYLHCGGRKLFSRVFAALYVDELNYCQANENGIHRQNTVLDSRFSLFILHFSTKLITWWTPGARGILEWLMTEFLQSLLFSWCLVITRLVELFSGPPVLMQSTKLRWIGILPTQSVSLYLCMHIYYIYYICILYHFAIYLLCRLLKTFAI